MKWFHAGIFGAVMAAAVASAETCPELDLFRIWVPADLEDARDSILAKAQHLNREGKCVTDGWYARQAGKYRFNVVPIGSHDSIGRVLSFSIGDMKAESAAKPSR